MLILGLLRFRLYGPLYEQFSTLQIGRAARWKEEWISTEKAIPPMPFHFSNPKLVLKCWWWLTDFMDFSGYIHLFLGFIIVFLLLFLFHSRVFPIAVIKLVQIESIFFKNVTNFCCHFAVELYFCISRLVTITPIICLTPLKNCKDFQLSYLSCLASKCAISSFCASLCMLSITEGQ